MNKNTLAGLQIIVEGDNPFLRDAVEELFQFHIGGVSTASLRIKTHSIDNETCLTMIPKWLDEKLPELGYSDEVFMFYGPEGDRAAIAKNEKDLSCAWLSKTLDEIVFLHVHEKCEGESKGNISLSSVIIPLLRDVLISRGQLLMHSAGIKCPDGTGIMIAADSGGGKTTTTLSLLRQGAKLLADDLTIGLLDQQEINISGFIEKFNLTKDTINHFDELAPVMNNAPNPDNAKVPVSPFEIFGDDCVVDTNPLQIVYFVNVTLDEGPFVKPMSYTEGLGLLLKAHTFARGQKVSQESMGWFFNLKSKVKFYSLGTGPDPEFIGSWIINNCSQHS